MQKGPEFYQKHSEAMIINLARTGEVSAFEELVRRRQSAVRNLMRRFCTDTMLAEDLAQQVFLKVWEKLPYLKKTSSFGSWIQRISVTTWLQYLRKKDALRGSQELTEQTFEQNTDSAASMEIDTDLERALAILPPRVRLCLVLSYKEGMSHSEITEMTKLPLGTVKSHIKRGAEKLKQLLAAYQRPASGENVK